MRQPPVVLRERALLLPIFNCVTVPGEKWVGDEDTRSVWWSDDAGATWTEARCRGHSAACT